MGNKHKKKESGRTFEQELAGVIVCCFAVFLGVGILLEGSMGSFGNGIISFLFGMFGITNYLIPFAVFILGINLIMQNRGNRTRVFKLFLMFSVRFFHKAPSETFHGYAKNST